MLLNFWLTLAVVLALLPVCTYRVLRSPTPAASLHTLVPELINFRYRTECAPSPSCCILLAPVALPTLAYYVVKPEGVDWLPWLLFFNAALHTALVALALWRRRLFIFTENPFNPGGIHMHTFGPCSPGMYIHGPCIYAWLLMAGWAVTAWAAFTFPVVTNTTASIHFAVEVCASSPAQSECGGHTDKRAALACNGLCMGNPTAHAMHTRNGALSIPTCRCWLWLGLQCLSMCSCAGHCISQSGSPHKKSNQRQSSAQPALAAPAARALQRAQPFCRL